MNIALSRYDIRGRGFTLVELLVVIGIIAMLIAIVLPVFAKAQEASHKAACLSNLRQVHAAFNLYALENKDRVPLGYRAGRTQWNSMIYSATAGRLTLFGILYDGREMPDPRILYCPAESNPQAMFNTAANPWPPGADPARSTYAGYGCRPEVELADDPAQWGERPLPRLAEFRDRAILADPVSTSKHIDSRHRDGVNVLYGDGSARWIQRSRFVEPLASCPAISAAANSWQWEIWTILDRR